MAIALQPRVWLERRRARRDADYWIAHGFEARYPWRVAELTNERERRISARSLAGVLGEVRGSKLPGVTPLRRGALRPQLAQLEAIEARLLDGAPVAAIGMLAVDELLTSPGSCLFAEVDSVERCLRSVLVKLKVQ
ncbi:MAG: hypothetical protein ACXVQQ_02400 [Gaiellaceae bacterium]